MDILKKRKAPRKSRIKDSRSLAGSSHHLLCSIGALLLAGALIFSSCDSNSTDAEEPLIGEVEGLDVTPQHPTLEEGESIKFSAEVLTATGDRIPLSELPTDWSWLWITANPEVATFETTGISTSDLKSLLSTSDAEEVALSSNSGLLTANGAGSTVCFIFLARPPLQRLNTVEPITIDTYGVTVIAPTPAPGVGPMKMLIGN